MGAVPVREAVLEDVDLLVTMMSEFYAEAGFPLNAGRARSAFEELLRNPVYGRSFLVALNGEDAGYLVLTLTYSMEYGGLAAFIDDFYLRPAFRGRGVGSAALAAVRDHAVGLGVRAIHLEVGRDNAPAQAVYRKTGFADNDRQLLTLRLAAATHEAGGAVEDAAPGPRRAAGEDGQR